jgi:hypothetical protein
MHYLLRRGLLLAVIGLVAYRYRRQEARSAELAPVATVR